MPTIIRLTLIVLGVAAYLGLAVLGWGGFAAFFAHPALIALAIVTFALSGAAFFAGGNLSPGEREDRGNRWVIGAFALIGLLDAYPAGLYRPNRVLDHRRRGHSLARRRAVRRRRRAAAVAGRGARPPVQRVGGDPAWAHPGHQRRLRGHPPSQLSGVAGQFAGLGPGLPLDGRGAADGAADPAARRPHPRRRTPAAQPIRRGIRQPTAPKPPA